MPDDARPTMHPYAPAPAAPTPTPPGVDPDTFRATLGRFATGVTVVTALADGRPHGMTVSAFCSLSLTPPQVLVCLDRRATMHDLLVEGVPVAINVLAAGQEALSRRFATDEPAERFAGVGYARGATGAPLLDGTLAWVEGHVAARHAGGDHTIVVVAVEEAGTREARPLLYYRSGYASLER